jgi:hypothetical protein
MRYASASPRPARVAYVAASTNNTAMTHDAASSWRRLATRRVIATKHTKRTIATGAVDASRMR